ncbi:MAG: TonB-dependent receptor [Chloroflexota bacterium]
MSRLPFLLIVSILLAAYPAIAQKSAVSGTVRELHSGEAMPSATVMIVADTATTLKGARGTRANKFGFYSIPGLAPGKYKIVSRSVGYIDFESNITIEPGKDLVFNIELLNRDVRTQEITVEAEREPTTHSISMVSISPEFINKMPSMFGERDLFRTLQLLPGVKQNTELSAGLYIRGGSPDQNLNLLDGVIVYNPSHLGGFFSTFNTDALRDVKLIKGAFPAEYGGRISSVLDLTMKEGTKEKFTGSGGISLISSRLTLEGPIGDNMTYMISGRRTYLDAMLYLFLDKEDYRNSPTYYFYDFNAKTNIRLGDKDQIFLSGYFGDDVFKNKDDWESEANFGIDWGNTTGNLRWAHVVSPTLFTNFSLIYSRYNFGSSFSADDTSSASAFNSFSRIQDLTAKGEAQYYPQENHIVKTGFELTNHRFENKVSNEILNEFDILDYTNQKFKAWDLALFLQDEWTISDKLFANIGARFYYFSEGNYTDIEPRLMLNYQVAEGWTLKSSFAIANQYLHLIEWEQISLPTDLWFPSTSTIKPSRSTQGVLGLEHTFNGGEYLFTVEGYYKDMKRLYEYKEDATFSFGMPLESQFTSGKGWAYGAEFFLQKRTGKFTGWIGYTLAWTKRKFEDLNNGEEYFPRYDRRHDVSVVGNYELGKKWEISATWVYGTGQAYTVPSGSYRFTDPVDGSDYGDYWNRKYLYTKKNGFRLPAYHRLDINFLHKVEYFGKPFEWSFNFYNVYNHMNPFAWFIGTDYDYNSPNYNKTVVKQITLFPFFPVVGLNFKI